MSDNDERNDDRAKGDGERRRPRRDDAGSQAGRGRSVDRDRPRRDGTRDERGRAGTGGAGTGGAGTGGAGTGGAGTGGAGTGGAGRGRAGTGGAGRGRGGTGGAGAGRAGEERQSGQRLTPKTPRLPEPAIRDGITGQEVDRSVKTQLRTLSKENAEGVAKHLVMVAELLDVEPEAALAHAETAVRRAGRIPAAREALGLVAYRMGDWARALSEFRTVRRLSGSSHLLALMVDCERALGRQDKALELAQSDESKTLAIDDRAELAIVVSGIRRDRGQPDAALAVLADLVRSISPTRSSAPRLYYAYAEAKLALGDQSAAREWFARAVDADHDFSTDAAERLDELDGISAVDLLGDEQEPGQEHEEPGE